MIAALLRRRPPQLKKQELFMNNQQSVRHALMCLRALGSEEKPFLSACELSRQEGLPLHDCQTILDHLCASGIVSRDAEGRFALCGSLEDITALDVVRALTPRPKSPPVFSLLYSACRGALRPALRARAWSDAMGVALAG